MHQRMINQKENKMIRRVFFLLALASAGVLLGASAVLAILNGNVALFAGCATMMLVVAAISLWVDAHYV
jgi:hypothetical protein